MTEKVGKLLAELRSKKVITVVGKTKTIIGVARYATLNNPEAEYIKVAFADGSGMYFPLDEDALFLFDQKIDITGKIDTATIGKVQRVTLDNVVYTLVNGNDYQFVKEFYVGTIRELEGEVRFSDYEDANGNILSLGVTSIDNKRADVLARITAI